MGISLRKVWQTLVPGKNPDVRVLTTMAQKISFPLSERVEVNWCPELNMLAIYEYTQDGRMRNDVQMTAEDALQLLLQLQMLEPDIILACGADPRDLNGVPIPVHSDTAPA